jgi:uncharacterized protein YxeA
MGLFSLTDLIVLALAVVFTLFKMRLNGMAYYVEKDRLDKLRKEQKRKNRMKGTYAN